MGAIFNPAGHLPFEISCPGGRRRTRSRWKASRPSRACCPVPMEPADYNRFATPSSARGLRQLRAAGSRSFRSATNVRTGKGRVFETHEVSVDVVLASSCLPTIPRRADRRRPVLGRRLHGQPGPLPLMYGTATRDIIIVHITHRAPRTPQLPPRSRAACTRSRSTPRSSRAAGRGPS